jgi:hypothetical protein
MAAAIARLLRPEGGDREFLARLVRPALRNWRGTVVGSIRPAESLCTRSPH